MITAEERRAHILDELKKQQTPLSATALAKVCGVSRQIIVGDIALLRASGISITATARGYLLTPADSGITARIACSHTAEQMAEELYAIVDQGCTVIDVIVEHPVYNEITGKLQLASRYDVDQFLKKTAQADALPLSALTEGVHLHTVSGPNEEALQRVRDTLQKMGILLT